MCRARKQGVKYKCFFIILSKTPASGVYTKIHCTACCELSQHEVPMKISFVHNVCYLHWCAFNWLQSFILNKSFHSTMSFTHKLQKWIPIVVPKLRQFSAGWKLATGQFQSDFHCSVPNVVVILHTTSQGVPSCSIGCSITELWGSNLKIQI